MDQHTLELLEFAKLRELVAAHAATSLGKEAARSLAPGTDLAAINRRSNLTSEMSEALSTGLTPPFAGLGDIRALARRAAVGGVLEADELATAAETLGAVTELDRWLDRVGSRFPRLAGLRETIAEYSGVVAAVSGCLDRRGKVLDTASRKLSTIRGEISKVSDRIQEILQAMLRSPELRRCLRYPNFTMVGHHYVLPVARDFRGGVEGAIQRTSASNETVYIEPKAIAEQSAQLAFLRAREDKEIRRILRWLSAQVGQVADDVVRDLGTLGELDLVHAQARLAIEFRMTPPDFSSVGPMALDSARHPLLENIFKTEDALTENPQAVRREVVPIDLRLGSPYRLLIVTGPNTGGKTVALKTAALLAVMAQSGMHIPARAGARLPVFDQILADIGDEQSLEQSLSTFSSHMRRVTAILGSATERSFVILDELGAGTDPAEGAALGRAILDELDSIGCLAIVTTHLGELKTYALSNPRARNAAVEFDLETLEPRYKLHLGDVGRSNALLIARRLNVPGHLVDRAAGYLGQGSNPLGNEWDELQKLRREAEHARMEAEQAKTEAQAAREELVQKLTQLDQASAASARLEEARLRLKPGDLVVAARFGNDRPGRIVKLDTKKKSATIAIGQMQWDVAIDELVPLATIDSASSAKSKDKPTGKPAQARLDDFPDDPRDR